MKYVVKPVEAKEVVPDKHFNMKAKMLLTQETVGIKNLTLIRGEYAVNGGSEPHAHEYEQVFYILKGKGKAAIDGQVFTVVEGDSIYFPAGKSHSIVNVQETPLWVIVANATPT
jgi:quercetin dioxygenase-like cupin family protein